MGAKVHKSLRFESALVDRVERLRQPGENFTNAVNRILEVGARVLENGTQTETAAHVEAQAKAQAEYDEKNEKIISLLEAENARLLADHEADRAAIAEKDRQLAEAMERAHALAEKAHDLADQSHVLIGMTQAKQITDGGEVLDVTQANEPEKGGFWGWVKRHL